MVFKLDPCHAGLMRIWPVLAVISLFACEKPKPPPATAKTPASAPAQPASKPSAQPSAAGSPHDGLGDKPFSGLVKLSEGSAAKPSDILFIMARQAVNGGQPGRLIAVQRHQGAAFPMRYEMSAKNLMMPATPFKGPFIVQARLDRDGDPMTKGNDDLYGDWGKPVGGGQEGVHLMLTKRSEAEAKKAALNAAPASRPSAAPAKPASAPAAKPAWAPAGKPPAKPASAPAKAASQPSK